MTFPLANLHVLLVVDSLDCGGAEVHVVGLASVLAQLGHRPEIACSIEGALAPAARAEGIPVHSLMSGLVKRKASLAYGCKLRSFLSTHGPFDVVHAHLYASLVAAAYATQRTGVPLISTEHSEAKWRGTIARRLCRPAYGAAAAVIAVSEGIRSRLVEQDHVSPAKVQVIMNAVSPLRSAPTATAEAEYAELAGDPLIGVIGRLHPEKGIRHFIEAASLISDRLPDARFAVIGNGPEWAELTQLAQRLRIADKVSFLGYRENAARMLQKLNVLVVPSISEGTPLIVLEGMHAGVPLVASAAGGIPEQITHGRDGLLVPAGDFQAIADAAVRLHQTPALGAALADAAKRRAAEYDHNAMVARTEAVYLAALRRRGSIAGQKRAAASASDPRLRPELGTEVKSH